MSDFASVRNISPGNSHVLLRVPQADGSVSYELYYERKKRPTGGRFVVFVASGDLDWAEAIARQLDIPEKDVRIY